MNTFKAFELLWALSLALALSYFRFWQSKILSQKSLYMCTNVSPSLYNTTKKYYLLPPGYGIFILCIYCLLFPLPSNSSRNKISQVSRRQGQRFCASSVALVPQIAPS